MSKLTQCKKLIAESEKEKYKPTISHYRDIENSMKKVANSLSSYAYQPQIFNESVKYTVRYIRKDLANKDRIAGFSTLTKAREYTDKIRKELKGKYSNIRITEYRVKNPTTKTTVRKTFVKKTVTKNPSIAAKSAVALRGKVRLRTGNGSRPVALESFTASEQRQILAMPQYFELDNGYVYLKRKNPTTTKPIKKVAVNPKTIKKANFTNADYKAHQTKTLTELARMFQGGINGDNRRVIESDLTPNGKFRLGHLVQMKVKRNGRVIPIEFDGESFLSADTKKHLWISGKDSMIKNGLSSIGLKKPSKGQLTIIGDLMQIDYVTAKKHIENGQTVRFFHKLGEATGERPKLALDYDGFPIVLGGNYDIWNVGIVN